jgi:nucleotidyltransferase/DNA polymerase involved in DNA repair
VALLVWEMFDRYLVGRLERQQESVRDLADEVADVFLVREPIEARIDADGAKRLRVFGKTFRLEPCPGNLAPVFIAFGGVKLKYERFSRFMFSYAYDFTPTVEVASIDEGYFDLRGNRKRPAREIAEVIRKAIGQSLKISVSEGIASNKLVSAVASKLKKPSCFLEVASGGERDFLCPLETKWLPGVRPQMAKTLNQAGLVRIGQLAEVRPEQLSLFAGKVARQFWEFAHGIDERPVVSEPPAAKSYSEQETFEQDVTDEDWILAKLRSLADRLLAKVRSEAKAIRTVEVRVGLSPGEP